MSKKKAVNDEQLGAFLEAATNSNNPAILGLDYHAIFLSPKMNDFATSNGWKDFRFGGEEWENYGSATTEAKASFLKEKFTEAAENKEKELVRTYLKAWLEEAILSEHYAMPPPSPASDSTQSSYFPNQIETGGVASAECRSSIQPDFPTNVCQGTEEDWIS